LLRVAAIEDAKIDAQLGADAAGSGKGRLAADRWRERQGAAMEKAGCWEAA
jgi:hypothetical protein